MDALGYLGDLDLIYLYVLKQEFKNTNESCQGK